MKLTISQFAETVNSTVRTLRYYEKLGILIPSERNEKNHKIYTRKELRIYYNIMLLKSLHMSLREIEKWLSSSNTIEEIISLQKDFLLDKRDSIDFSINLISRTEAILNKKIDLTEDQLLVLINSIHLEKKQKDVLNRYYSN